MKQDRKGAHWLAALPRNRHRSLKESSPSLITRFLVPAFVASTVMACAREERPALVDTTPGVPTSYDTGPCEEGSQRECGVTLSHGAGVMSCYRGKQHCNDGEWGPCADGIVTKEAIFSPNDDRKGHRPLALSAPEPCNDSTGTGGGSSKYYNPCDPRCMFYDEIKEVTPDPAPGAGGLPDWSSPPGTATCSHDLCTTGSALDASCHACAARVCAIDDTCCIGPTADTWDDDCVDLVHSECGSSTVTPPVTLCDFTAFGQDYVTLGNGSSGYPTIGSSGDVTAQNPAQLGPIVATGTVNLRNNTTVMGDVITEGDIWLESPATVTGDLWAGDRIDIRNNTVLAGSAIAAGVIEIQGGSSLSGDVWGGSTIWMGTGVSIGGDASSVGNMYGQTGVLVGGTANVQPPSTIDALITAAGGKSTAGPVSAPVAPVVALPDLSGFERDLASSCSTASTSTIYVGSTVTLAPGIYGNYTINGSGRLRLLDGGTYIFRSLRFNNGSEMWLDGTAPWDVSVCDDFHSDANVKYYIDGTTTPPNAEDFLVYSDATSGDCIYIGDNNVFNGMFIAPKCRIRVYNNSVATAALWGEAVYTNSNFTLNNIPKEVCDAANQWGSATCDGTTPLYKDGRSYTTGSRVHYRGNIYECATSALCSAGGGYGGAAGYWPGEGTSWDASMAGGAWYFISACPPPPDDPAVVVVPECPVDLALPGTPPPRQDCYSGLDCQVNARCTEVLTNAACAHDKCSLGAALDETCDPCVAMICDADPTCCTDTGGSDWDANCVAQVAAVCDAACGAVVPGCAHDACVTGPALDSSCDANVGIVCAQMGFEYCCDLTTPGTWDQACIDELYVQETGMPPASPPDGESICDYAILGQGAAQLNSVEVDGSVAWLSGAVVLQEQYSGAGYAHVTGDFVAYDNATLYHVDVGGDVLIALGPGLIDGLTMPPWPDSTIGGMATLSGATVPSTPPRPTMTMTCPTGGADSMSASGLLTPGTYGQVTLAGDITLQGGDYYLESLTNVGHTIFLPADPDELVNIYVCQNVEIHNGAELLSPGSNPLQARVYTHSGVMNLGAMGVPTTLWGIFQANAGTITMSPAGNGLTVYGMVHSYFGTVQGNDGVYIDTSGYTRADCINRGVDTSASPSTCPITTTLTPSVTSSGTCVENGTDYQVASSICGDVDLAVGRSCQDQITICNHGATDVPAGEVELTFYPRAGQQFATESPDPAWSVGTCVATSPLFAGSCIDQVCPAMLVDQDLTVMARLAATSVEVECSELDNWSYYVEGDSCPVSDSKVEIQTYEAVCPSGSSVSWGFLVWDTTLVGSDTVTFSARTSIDGVFSGTPTYLGTSELSPDDTSNCTFVSPLAQCPVDVGSTLWPSGLNNQPAHLELTITLNPSGTDLPTLHDWGLTYSCRYDE